MDDFEGNVVGIVVEWDEEYEALVAGEEYTPDKYLYFGEDSVAEDGLGRIGPLEDNMELVVVQEDKMEDMDCWGQGSGESCSCRDQSDKEETSCLHYSS